MMLDARTRPIPRRTHRDAFMVPFLVAVLFGCFLGGSWQGQSTANGDHEGEELESHDAREGSEIRHRVGLDLSKEKLKMVMNEYF